MRITKSFLSGLGNSPDQIFEFAVQFLTVPSLVKDFTRQEAAKHPGRPIVVEEFLKALQTVFESAVDSDDLADKKGKDGAVMSFNVDHPAISNQKYKVSSHFF